MNVFLAAGPYALYLPVVPHKAVAEVSRIVNVKERLIAVSDGCQSKNIDQLTN